MEPFIITFILILIIFYILNINKRRSKLFKDIPGPWGLPIVGYLPLLGKYPFRTAMKLEKIYGPIFRVNFGSFPAIIVNNTKLIKDLLKNPIAFSRPPFLSIIDIGGKNSFLFNDGDDWKELKKLCVQGLKKFGNSNNFAENCTREEIHHMLEKIEKNNGNPINLIDLFQTPIAIQSMMILTGERMSPENVEFKKNLRRLESLSPDEASLASIALVVPWMTKIGPWFNKLIGYDKPLKPLRKLKAYLQAFIDSHKIDYQRNEPRDLIDMFLDKIEEASDLSINSVFHPKNNPENKLIFFLLDVFTAAGDTTLHSLCWTMIALAKYQDIQESLYKETIELIGNSRIPSFEDRKNLLHTEAFINEVLRIRPVLPFGVARNTQEDIQIEGLLIPKGTAIFPNFYAAHHDKTLWENPEEFNPTRFFQQNGEINKNIDNLLTFSVGKRKCVGEISARETLFMCVTSIIQKFKILPAPHDEPNFKTKNYFFPLAPICQTVVFHLREPIK